jgi:hypothetical protein
MRPITITIHVNAAAAIRAGRGRAGGSQLVLDETDLAQLSTTQRETLAKHYDRFVPPWGTDRGPQWSDPLAWHAEPVATASLHVLRELLDRRAFVMENYAEHWSALNEAHVRDVLYALAQHLPEQDIAGFSWPVIESALRVAARRCTRQDLATME